MFIDATIGVSSLLILAIAEIYNSKLSNSNFIAALLQQKWLEIYLQKACKLLNKFGQQLNLVTYLGITITFVLILFLVQGIIFLTLGKFGMIVWSIFVLYWCIKQNNPVEYQSLYVSWHEQSFAIIFWYTTSGPIGCLFYKYLIVSKFTSIIDLDSCATKCPHTIAAWLPARLTGLVYALMGNFVSGFTVWKNCLIDYKMPSSDVLCQCGKASDLAIVPQSSNDLSEQSDENAQHSSEVATQGEEGSLVLSSFYAWIVLGILLILAL